MNLGREDEFQEFKEGLGQLDKGLKSLTAMLNRHNIAIVYFGVDDNGNVVGLQTGAYNEEIKNLIDKGILKFTFIFPNIH